MSVPGRIGWHLNGLDTFTALENYNLYRRQSAATVTLDNYVCGKLCGKPTRCYCRPGQFGFLWFFEYRSLIHEISILFGNNGS
jgi:hypothetical protein